MNKPIPYLFENVVISSPLTEIMTENGATTGRAKVRVFTKYANRNGSYITEEFANHLIESAVLQHCPIVGFFDPETETWAGHTGPTLACGYGYVEDFLGWEPFEDTDGITRDYAVFSVVLHTNYFKEANLIVGKNQSMELDPETIDGDWAVIDGEEYYVYTKGEMLGFCVIGDNEPCFSASVFFNKEETKFERFSSLLFELRTKVEETTNLKKEGGDEEMEDNMNFEAVQQELEELKASYAALETELLNTQAELEQAKIELEDFKKRKSTCEADLEAVKQENANYQAELEEVKANYEELKSQYDEAMAQISNYQEMENKIEEDKKDSLINSYEKVLDEEEIKGIKESKKDFTYSELESKLAITFSRKQLEKNNLHIPLVEEEESAFAKLMKKYKK